MFTSFQLKLQNESNLNPELILKVKFPDFLRDILTLVVKNVFRGPLYDIISCFKRLLFHCDVRTMSPWHYTHVYIAILGLGYSIGGIVHPNFQAEFLSSVECESNWLPYLKLWNNFSCLGELKRLLVSPFPNNIHFPWWDILFHALDWKTYLHTYIKLTALTSLSPITELYLEQKWSLIQWWSDNLSAFVLVALMWHS